jgi:alkanesulfonate monooxygenase SsuD/methylene tetrahydromethanopterin reductase-like flavin-dependent oxidoreductase (luciferase family)
MKFGLFSEFELGRGTYDRVTSLYDDYIRQACFAEEHGFESIWVLEHHFTDLYSYCAAPEILLATLAARTGAVRLGCGVCLLPYHNPVTVAERYATLDHLCHGRLEFGIGRGVPSFEWNKFRSEPFEQGRDIMYEALEVVLKCWTGEDFVHNGKYFKIDKPINVIPKPMQKPHPRIHAAITSPDSAATYGAKGWETMSIARVNPLFDIAQQAAGFRAARARAGGRGEFSVLVDIHCAPTDREADERFSVYHKWFFTEMGRTYYPLPQSGAPADMPSGNSIVRYLLGQAGFEEFKRTGMVISGSPRTCIEELRKFEAAGADRIMCQFKLGLMPHRETIASMELFAREVMPAFAHRA